MGARRRVCRGGEGEGRWAGCLGTVEVVGEVEGRGSWWRCDGGRGVEVVSSLAASWGGGLYEEVTLPSGVHASARAVAAGGHVLRHAPHLAGESDRHDRRDRHGGREEQRAGRLPAGHDGHTA